MKHHMPESHANHPNVVPMIDVIMCLIIFYMLVAKIGVDTGEDDSVKLPIVKLLGKELKSMDNSLLINVKEVNNAPVVSALVDASEGKRRELLLEGGNTKTNLQQILRALVSGKDHIFGNKDDNRDFKLIIRGDNKMRFKVLEKVLMSASQAKIQSIHFQTSTTGEDKTQ